MAHADDLRRLQAENAQLREALADANLRAQAAEGAHFVALGSLRRANAEIERLKAERPVERDTEHPA